MKRLFVLVVLAGISHGSWAQHEIGEGLTDDLDGMQLAWEYSGGRHYEIRFEDGMLTYHRTNGDVAREWRSLVPYSARKVGNGQYLVGWHETDLTNYVTLFFHLEEEKVYSSALLGNYDMIHFQEGRITGISPR